MALCTICSSISFTSLPEPPSHKGCHYVRDDRECVEFMIGRGDEGTIADIDRGLPWHENLESLAESARSWCPLCVVVFGAVQGWKSRYEKAASSSAFYQEFADDYVVDLDRHPLWLARRYDGAHGLLVFGNNARYYKSPKSISGVVLLASLAFTVEAQDPLANEIPIRTFNVNPAAPESLDVVANWIQNCCENHERCSSSDTPLPTRLVDIGSGPTESIRLVEPRPGQMGKYASLSYCWGTSRTLTTTRDSHAAHTSEIPWSSLPKAFQDAITITRYLGLRYIWIDGLCIFQDDHDDWARESSRMFDVYSNAHVVIAASSAANTNEGCLRSRRARIGATMELPQIGKVHAQLLYNNDAANVQIFNFEREPLSQRAWALQERLLAQRILHYTNKQVYFECNHGMVSEDGCKRDYRDCDLRGIRQSEATIMEIRNTWASILWAYGLRHLTNPTDKFPALSGIAKLIKNALQEEYIAGIWSGAIIPSLAWQGIGAREPQSNTEYVGPSWSWASYKGITSIRSRKGWRDIADVEDWRVELEKDDDPHGRIKDAWIQLRAPLAKLERSTISTNEHEERLKRAGTTPYPRFLTKYSTDEEGQILIIDYQEHPISAEIVNQDIQILLLGGIPHELGEEKAEGGNGDGSDENKANGLRIVYCLALVPAQKEGTQGMKRVGWMYLDGEEAKKLVKAEEEWETITIF